MQGTPSGKTLPRSTYAHAAGMVVLMLALCPPLAAQPATLSVYQGLAVDCLGAAPDAAMAFHLTAPAQMPYLRTALVNHWQADGRQVYVGDTLQRALPTLAYQIEAVGVSYARASRKTLTRHVRLGLRYTVVGPDGVLRQDARCQPTFSDTLPRAARSTVEDPAFPETQGTAPEGGWMRRFLEPAVVTAATAITVLLFFTLRSERGSDNL